MNIDFHFTFKDIKTIVNEDTANYIKTSQKLKTLKDTQKLSYFQILKYLDDVDAALILKHVGKYEEVPVIIIRQYVTFAKDLDGNVINICNHSGMDCYEPYDQQRDYLIKKWMKIEKTEG